MASRSSKENKHSKAVQNEQDEDIENTASSKPIKSKKLLSV